ncbi:MAG: PAS domain-containing protein [Fimbriimonadaceae bacterium]|nr:PAS domain-containing protein [Fimbriimonadaceae bacterium]
MVANWRGAAGWAVAVCAGVTAVGLGASFAGLPPLPAISLGAVTAALLSLARPDRHRPATAPVELAAVAGAGVVVVEWSAAGNAIRCNQAFYQLIGEPPGSWDGPLARLTQAFHPQVREQVRSGMQALTRGEVSSIDVAARLAKAGGGWAWGQLQVRVTGRDAAGQVQTAVLVWLPTADQDLSPTLLRRVAEVMSFVSGDAYFETFAQTLAAVLEVDAVLVLAAPAGQPVEVVCQACGPGLDAPAVAAACRQVDPAEWVDQLTGPQRVPLPLAALAIEVAFGLCLRSPDGQPLGRLVLLHRQPLADPRAAFTLLQIYAARTAAELGRQLAVNALARSERGYRRLLDNAQDAVFIVEAASGTILEVNRRAAELVGRPMDELRGLHQTALHPAELADSAQRSFQAAAEGPAGVQPGIVVQHAAGYTIPCDIAVSHWDEDGRRLVMGIFRDASERVRAEEALRLSEERLRQAISALPVIMFATNRQGVFAMSEGRGLQLLGLRPGQVVGQSVFEVYRRRPPILDHFSRAVQGAQVTAVVEVDGHHWDTWYTPIIDRRGQVVGVSGIATDVTPRIEMEAERQALEAQLHESQRMASLGVLTTGIAHEFNNLLTTVLGNTDLLLRDADRDADDREILGEVVTAAHSAAELCRQMLAYTGRSRTTVVPLDLAGLLAELQPMLLASLRRNIELQLHLPADLPAVLADAGELRQVVVQLVLNAAQAIGEDQGRIDLTIEPATSADGAPQVALAVADSGPGFAPEALERAFEPFFTTRAGQRGLGLAVVQGIARAHGAEVQVQSSPGCGATVTLRLPASTQPLGRDTAAPHGGDSLANWRGSGLVLVADDDESVRDVACRVLTRAGLEVVAVADGQAAVEEVAARPDEFALALVDYTMPRLDGLAAAKQLLALQPELPVLLTSGYHEGSQVDTSAIGLAGFIAKPYTSATLFQHLQRLLGPPDDSPPAA